MTATSFVDTHILLYAASNAAADQAKRQVARALLTRADIGFSAQVLQEFYAAAIAKQRLQMTHDAAVAVLQSLAAFPVCPITRHLVLTQSRPSTATASPTGVSGPFVCSGQRVLTPFQSHPDSFSVSLFSLRREQHELTVIAGGDCLPAAFLDVKSL